MGDLPAGVLPERAGSGVRHHPAEWAALPLDNGTARVISAACKSWWIKVGCFRDNRPRLRAAGRRLNEQDRKTTPGYSHLQAVMSCSLPKTCVGVAYPKMDDT